MGSLENKLVILLISTFLICGTILYLVLFWVLWPYRVAVAISLLLCIATLIGVLCYVHARGRLIEQDVRTERYECTSGKSLWTPKGNPCTGPKVPRRTPIDLVTRNQLCNMGTMLLLHTVKRK